MKILKFVKEYGTLIILLLTIVLFFRTCGMNVAHDKEMKELNKLNNSIDHKMDSINLVLQINKI
jgi:hypothetical protein